MFACNTFSVDTISINIKSKTGVELKALVSCGLTVHLQLVMNGFYRTAPVVAKKGQK